MKILVKECYAWLKKPINLISEPPTPIQKAVCLHCARAAAEVPTKTWNTIAALVCKRIPVSGLRELPGQVRHTAQRTDDKLSLSFAYWDVVKPRGQAKLVRQN